LRTARANCWALLGRWNIEQGADIGLLKRVQFNALVGERADMAHFPRKIVPVLFKDQQGLALAVNAGIVQIIGKSCFLWTSPKCVRGMKVGSVLNIEHPP